MSSHEHHTATIEESDPDTFTTVLVGVIGSVIVVALVVFLQGLYGSAGRAEFRRKVVDLHPLELQAIRGRQLERLSTAAWVDKAHAVASIPLDRAMALVVANPGLTAVPPPVAVAAPAAPTVPTAPTATK